MKLRPIIAVAACGAIGFFLLSAFVERMIFYPARYPEGLWELADDLGSEDVAIETEDGIRLHGWRVASSVEPPAVTTLLLHGNAGNLTHRIDHLQAIPAAGSELLIIDYRGYGKSEGAPSEQGSYADARAAYDWLAERGRAADRIVCHGESLGTAVAVDLATHRPCAGLVLEAPFPSARAVASQVLPGLGPLLVSGFDTVSKLRGIRVPLLVIHGALDETFPFEFGRRVYEAAAGPKELWKLEGAGHNDILRAAGADYVPRLERFYRQVTAAAR